VAGQDRGPEPAQGPRAHDIGAGGVVTVAVDADDIRIQGVEGTEVRVVAPADGVGIATEAQPGRFSVRTLRRVGSELSGFVGLKVGRREFGFPLGLRVSGTIELEVPRDARVEVQAAAGDVAIRDVHGGAVVKITSGDVSIKGAAGPIAVNVASGDVTVIGAQPISLDVHSMAGDVRARAPRFERVAIETVSGDAELAGTFGTAARHVISTVSGDVELAVPGGGLTVEVRTVSGDVSCHHPDRRDGDGRKRPLVIGDGAALLAIRTMSGDVEIRPGRVASPAPFPGALVPPAAPMRPTTAGEGPDATTLTVLEALARGEIDVVEAERRLAGSHTPHEAHDPHAPPQAHEDHVAHEDHPDA
jgi:predicted membrane protein